MLRLVVPLALLLAGTATCRAQEEPARYTVFGEVLGNTGFASLNFDITRENGVGLRVGGFVDPRPLFSCDDRDLDCRQNRRDREAQDPTVFLTIMGHKLIGEEANKLELGLGLLLGHAAPGRLDHLPRAAITATFGYRIQPNVQGLGLRVGFTPIIAPDHVLLRPGFSLSYGLPTPR